MWDSDNPRAFRRLRLGALVMLFNGKGFAAGSGSGLWEVQQREDGPLWGQHGAVLAWTEDQSGGQPVAPAGYILVGNELSGQVPAVQSSGKPGVMGPGQPLEALQGTSGEHEMIQGRFIAMFGGTLPAAGWAVDDADVQIVFAGSKQRYGLRNVYGSLQNMLQVQLPGNAELLPNSGADIALPSVAPAIDPFESGMAAASECFWTGKSSPSVIINNTSAQAMDTVMWLALLVSGSRYRLAPYVEPSMAKRTLLGADISLPSSVTPEDIRERGRFPILRCNYSGSFPD